MKTVKHLDSIFVNKGWGISLEDIDEKKVGELFAYNKETEEENDRISADTVKILYLDSDKKLSLHFHCEKSEIFCCAYGMIKLEFINTETTEPEEIMLLPGHRVFVPRGVPHRMSGLCDLNILVEVSTQDRSEDSFRIEKGD